MSTDRSVGEAMPKELDTRTRILRAAFDLFVERTYKKVSVDQVAKKAGVSKGGLFHHFSSKYELGRDALIWWAEDMMKGSMTDEFQKMPPSEQLRFFIDMSVDIIVRNVNMGRLVIDLYEEALERKEDLDVWIKFLTEYVGVVEGIFKQLGTPNPRMRSMIMLSSMDGFAMYYFMLVATGEKIDMEEVKEEFYRLYMETIE